MTEQTDIREYIPRKQVLTEADLKELSLLLSKHPCQFQVTHEQMDNIVRMSKFFESVEKKILDGVTWFFIAAIGGLFYMLYNHGYFVSK